MIYRSEKALRVLFKALVTLAIPMVRCYVAEMAIISRSVGDDRNGEEEC